MPAAGGPPATLVELLAERARQDPGRVAYRFLANGEEEVESLSLGELDAGARRIAAELIGRGLAGERVLLLYPPGLGFVQAFLACLYARAVAVPAYPPQSERGLPRLVAMVRDAAPRGVLSPAGELSLARARDGARGELTGLEWVATDGLTGPVPAPGPGPRPDDLAFLQYTSGSTSTPKGVMVTHANLMDNEAVIRRAFGMQASDVVVGWLPLYHDMGLIGNVIQPLYSGASCVLMSPVAFLQQPRRWLAAIDRYRGTVSGGPNFAYDLCLRRLAPAARAGLDLSSWRVAFNGAEPIRAGTLAAFAAGFAPQGFRSRAFFPCYGLAEATLFVSGTGAGAGSHVLAAEGGPARVSSGAVAWGPEVRVVDPQTALPRAEGEEGEIWVRGGSVAAGYWGRPQASAATFGARLADGDGPFLRTGDLGFLVAGELFVTGRSKDLLIVRGRNHHPQDVELTAERASAALRPGCGAAFAIEPEDGEGAERVVLVFEVDRHSDQPIEVVAQAVRAAVAEEHELRLAELVLIRASTLPKTSSGKVQRHACRELYRRGELAVVGASRAPQAEELAAPPAAQPLSPEELASLAGEALQPGLERHLAARLVSLVGEPPAGYLDLPLASLGLDSLAAVELQHRLELDLGAAPGLDEVLAGANVRELAAGLAARLAARREAPTEAPTAEAVAVASTRSGAAAKRAPATAGQASLWYVEQLAPGRAVYNLPVACRLGAGVSPQALTRAWRELVARHPALRTTFREEADGLWLEEHGELVADLEALPSPASEEGLAAVLAAAAWEPFDLAAGPPARLRTLALADGGTLALFVVHHAVADFWSLTVLLRELAALLAAAPGVALGAVELPPPGPSPLGLAARERQRLAGAEAAALWSYWQARLTPLPPGLDLPLDRPRPARLSFAGATLARPLPPVVARAAAALARRQAATPFAVLFAATVAWLGRLAGARRLAVGTPAASRAAAELATTVGYLVNPLVLVEELAPSEAFTALVERVRGTVLGALAHQGLPFPVLAERLGGPRDPSRSPLFDVLFVLDRSPLAAAPGLARLAAGLAGPAVEVEGLVLAPVALPSRRAAFDLTVRLVETGDGLAAVLNYATDLFDATTVERWLGAFEVLLSGALADPTVAVGHLTLLSASQREQLLALAEGGEVADPGALLPALFAGQAAASPEAVALWDRAEQLSYGELARRVGKVAAGLRAAGVGPEVRVAVEMERTVALPTALLAVLSAGGATVPVDPAYPAARREFMLADSGAHLVVSDERFAGLLAAASAGETSAVPLLAANLATLIYTSGSTGTPKAVAVTHGSLAALLGWAAGAYSDAEIAVVLASTSVCFDISAFELYVPLTRGGRVVMAANVLELGELPAAGSLTLVNTVPSPFAEVLRAGVLPPSLVTVNLAGEPLPAALAAGIYTQGRVSRVLDLYGPSEDTVFSTWAEVPRPAGGEAGAKPLIGRPLPGTRALVLEPLTGPQGANLALLGVPGELFLAGAGLARGYLGRPGLTASRFVPCPSLWASEPGERLYRTGDLVRQLPDGSLDYLGRLDQQVKLRGFRLELGEIEAALARHPAVVEAAVAVQASPDGEPQLVAYWCQRPEAATPAAGELAEHLRQRLPAFAVPGHLRAGRPGSGAALGRRRDPRECLRGAPRGARHRHGALVLRAWRPLAPRHPPGVAGA